MDAKPQSRPRHIDIVQARPRPITTIALAVAPSHGGFRFNAESTERHWSGNVQAPNTDTAVLDALRCIVADDSNPRRVRLVVKMARGSALNRRAAELAVLLPGVWIEPPGPADRQLMEATAAGLKPDPVSGPPADLAPLVVATDGSVRGKFTGCGWLSDSGDFGLRGFRHVRRVVGPDVVLIAELRAIDDAVRQLPGRHLTVLTDSRAAITMVRRWMAGDDVLPEGYTTFRSTGTAGLIEVQQRMRLVQKTIEVRWVAGHQGNMLNEGADALARLASRYARRNSGLTTEEYQLRAEGLAQAFSAQSRGLRAG